MVTRSPGTWPCWVGIIHGHVNRKTGNDVIHQLNGPSVCTSMAKIFDVLCVADKVLLSLFSQNPAGSDESSIMLINRELSVLR